MEEEYIQIWESAKPYYEKGRAYDIPQIRWMVEEAERICKIKEFNQDLLFPIIILHDVGYSAIDNKNPNVKGVEVKKLHMREGAVIAQKILQDLKYDKNLSDKIIHYVSVHDNWALNDDAPFKECPEMALFNDLDFLVGIRDKEMFDLRAKSMKMSPLEMFASLENEEKLVRRPFCCPETQQLFDEFMVKRKEEIDTN